MPNLEFLEGRTQQSLTNWTTLNGKKTTVHSQNGKGDSFANKEQDHMPQQKNSQQNPIHQKPTRTSRVDKNCMSVRQRFSNEN